jgi:glycine hydroxymethyltransferase
MKEDEMVKVGDFLHRAVQISLALQKEAGSKLLKDFLRVATEGEGEGRQQLQQLAKDVEAFATTFPLPGITDTSKLVKPAQKPQAVNNA